MLVSTVQPAGTVIWQFFRRSVTVTLDCATSTVGVATDAHAAKPMMATWKALDLNMRVTLAQMASVASVVKDDSDSQCAALLAVSRASNAMPIVAVARGQ